MKLVLGALVALALLTLTGVAVAQTSELFLIWGPRNQPDYGETYVYQGGQLLRSWNHVGTREDGIAVVAGTVRQVAYTAGGGGAEYTLDGVPTGVTYSGAASVYDATSDGQHIYAWHWFDAALLQYDLEWQLQSTMFTLPPALSKAFMGITYDASTNSIWLVPWGWDSSLYGYLYNLSLDGRLLRTIELDDPGTYGNGLALDPADDTFWFFSWSNERLEQYSRDGVLLDSVVGMERIYGGEFHQPRIFSDGFESGDVLAWSEWLPHCSTNSDCVEGKFCKKNGCGDVIGFCRPTPLYCLDYWDPVCGCDGVTYSNTCYAERVGVNIASTGECPP